MANNRYDRRIIFSVLMLSAVLVGMTMLTGVAFAAPTIVVEVNNTAPQVNQTISISATAMDNGSILTSLNGTMNFLANSGTFANPTKTITGGMASTTFTTATAGTVTITVKINDTLQGIKTVDFRALPVPALSLSANQANVIVNTPINVNFIVNSAGVPVNDATVNLTGVATGNGITVNGIATINVNATSQGKINATATKNGYTSDFIIINADQPSLNISANQTNVIVNTPTNVNFIVNSAGVPVNDATVNLTGVATGNGITVNGIATINVNATSQGKINATATKNGYTSDFIIINAGQPPLSISATPTNVTVNAPTNVNFTVTSAEVAVTGALVTLSGAGVSTSATTDNGSVTIIVNATSSGNITATATKNGYPDGTINLPANIAFDTTPPESITNLTMEDHGTSWIKWNWTNPNPIGDFSYVAIWINNGWHNASGRAYSFNTSEFISSLSPGNYTIATHTVDTSGNVNSTWVNLTNSTLPNTPVSPSSITVPLSLNSSVTFASVTVAGNTVEAIDASGHTLPTSSFIVVGNYHNISTTANYNPPVTVSVQYNTPLPSGYIGSDVRLYHWNDSTSQWDNVTTSSGPGMVTGLVSSLSPFVPAIPAKPRIINKNPTDPFETIVNMPQTFNITVDQTANVTWYINSNIQPGNGISFNYTPSSTGNYNVSVSATNDNGTDTEYWNWSVHSTTFFTGNRIWDGSRPNDFSLNYTWTPQSFSGFYYDAKGDVGSESLTMKMDNYYSRTIGTGNIVYSTAPQEVSFTHTAWGTYQVIGFMADKYFAGYTSNTSPPITRPTTKFAGISSLAGGGLHRVLIDDDTKRTIAVGGTIALQDGYVLKATDIDMTARTMLLSLQKDGNEVDVSPLSAGETYVYTKNVGNVNLPLIMLTFSNVFSGSELQVAFIQGMFQISEATTTVQSGNQFGNMKISSVSPNGIQMTNSANIGLSTGATVDLMGNLQIQVANNNSAVRFALTVDNPSNQEVRSTVYRASDPSPVKEWTPYNFGMNIGDTSLGFYYNLDSGVGSEDLKLTANVSNGGSIPPNNLVYSTSPQEVQFTHTAFGTYQAIGFMADNYFAGYSGNTKPPNPTNPISAISSLAQGGLHKVLIDDDTKRTISVGGTIALQEGYVIKATDIDMNARTMLLSLMKDGTEVDVSPLAAGGTYVYTKTVGSTQSLPLIMVTFSSVFSGQELQVAFIQGMFQISEATTTVQNGNQFGNMEVTSVNANGIIMSNNNIIGLGQNSDNALMGNIRLKVADNPNLRFYFAVDVTPEMVASQLAIDAPAKAMAGDTIQIKVTANSVGIGNANINIGTASGTTDTNGIFNYTLPRSLVGTYSINASMTGYQTATKNIVIDKYIDYTLSIQAPSKANQSETITIKVLYNGTAMSGATVTFDNTTVGTTDSNGEVTYKLDTSGTHSISASKKSYLPVVRDIEIRALYSEFKALDINLTPNQGFVGDAYLVRSNITNVGTKGDSTLVELIVNGTSVDNKTVTLDAGGKVEVNFTRIETIAGNVTVQIMGQSMLYQAKEKPTNYLLIGVIVTAIGAIAIYILTSKGLLNLELLKQKFNKLFKKGE